MITAGAQHNLVKGIGTLTAISFSYNSFLSSLATVASQTAGTSSVGQLSQTGKACLFIHGTDDQCLPHRCSEQLYRLAGQPKELVLYDNDNHGVTKHRDEAKEKIKQFTSQYLCTPAQ